MDIQRQIQVFSSTSWQNKIEYMSTFYATMIKKANNNYIAYFQSKLDFFLHMEESTKNTAILIEEYQKILIAKQKTREIKTLEEEKKIQESLNRVKLLQS